MLAPLAGRLADRRGRRAVLVGGSLLNGAGIVALSIEPVSAVAVVSLTALLAGVASPPVAAIVRSVWPQLVEEGDRAALYAMDASLQELTFILGPALVAVIAAIAGDAAALQCCAALGVAGSVGLAALPALARRPASQTRLGGGVASTGLAVLSATGLLMAGACSVVQIAIVAFCTHNRSAAESGLVLAVWGFGSMLGGALVGTRVSSAGVSGVIGALCAVAAGYLLLVAAPGVALLYPLVLVAGVGMAPALGGLYHLVAGIASPERSVEAFSWVAAGLQAGFAGGAALGGVVVTVAGVDAGFAAAAGTTLLAALVLVVPGVGLHAAARSG